MNAIFDISMSTNSAFHLKGAAGPSRRNSGENRKKKFSLLPHLDSACYAHVVTSTTNAILAPYMGVHLERELTIKTCRLVDVSSVRASSREVTADACLNLSGVFQELRENAQ